MNNKIKKKNPVKKGKSNSRVSKPGMRVSHAATAFEKGNILVRKRERMNGVLGGGVGGAIEKG